MSENYARIRTISLIRNKVLKCVLSLNEQTKSRRQLSEHLARLNSLVKREIKVRFLSAQLKYKIMNTLNYHDVACKIYENHDYLNNGWSNDESFLKLDRSDRLKVSRIINNWIRQDFY